MSSAQSNDESSKENQRNESHDLKKNRSLFREANISNILNFIEELFMVNIVQGCGYFACSIGRA